MGNQHLNLEGGVTEREVFQWPHLSMELVHSDLSKFRTRQREPDASPILNAWALCFSCLALSRTN